MKKNIIEEDVRNVADGIGQDVQKLNGKTVLITGGAGFLGNYFLLTFDYLNKNVLKNPCRVISVDNFITGVKYAIEEGPNFKAIKHDVTVPMKINEDIDFIISAAGIASPKFYRKFKIETIDVGVFGTKNMLELAKEKKVKSMLYFSSSEVYGDPDPRFVPTNETYFGNVSCTGPRSNYDESKRLGETLCLSYYEAYDIPVKWVRPFNVYGPRMRLDDYRVIPNFISNIFSANPIPVYDDGTSTRTFCYITDAMTGFLRVLLSDFNGEAFNIGNDKEEVSIGELARIVAEIFNNKAQISYVPGPNDAYATADPRRRCPDLKKARAKLGYVPHTDLRTGLRRFIRWVIDEYEMKSPQVQVFESNNKI